MTDKVQVRTRAISPPFSIRGLVMSNSHLTVVDHRFSSYSRAGRAALRAGACGFILIAIFFAASCGLIDGSNSPQILQLSGNLPTGVANQAYSAVLTVGGGNAPYQFAVKTGTLPPGVTLNPKTGSIAGTPKMAGSYAFLVAASDAPYPDQGSQNFAISVASSGRGRIQVNVTPASLTLVSNQTQTFTATVSGTKQTGVTWWASAGSITNGGVYTAPQVNTPTNVTVTATSNADPSQQGSAAVVVDPANAQPLAITTVTLPSGQVGNSYDAVFAATGGTQPYSWSASGNIPPGLTLNPNSGDFGGMPGAPGSFTFTVTLTDAKRQTAQQGFTVEITQGGNFDGPAELPRITVASSMADTPAPGTVIQVPAGGNLQTALNNAQCGNTIELQAGATFTGVFTFPAKNCDDNHWIIVRTSAPDSALPAEGQRLTPCYAGVASLPGRPKYPCNNPQNVVAKLVYSGPVEGPVSLQSGANHYRLMGLEVTRATGAKGAPTLMSVTTGGVADHIVLDRSWVHGTTQDETVKGFRLNGINYAAVVDSYFNDFHCTAVTGTCTDSQAVGGGLGSHQDGPWKIEDNFLEAAGEGILFGGGAATTSPTDITIRFNHFFKPWQWMPGNVPFQGGDSGNPFIVKNHFELKNAVRVLLEANLMEDVWGGFTQRGHAILLTPKNQYSVKTHLNLCPLCQVTDVTIRYAHVAHAAGGIVLGTILAEGGAAALAGTRWSIHDVVLDDINKQYVGGGSLFEVENGWPVNPLNTVTINHVTGFPDPDGHLLSLGNKTSNPPMYGFVFTNNIATTSLYPVWSTGGGTASCAYQGTSAQKIANCFTTYTFTNNALVASPKAYPPSSWPDGNFFPSDPSQVDFTDYNNGNEGNYLLLPASPYKNKGTDGRDLGADITGLNTALAGVE